MTQYKSTHWAVGSPIEDAPKRKQVVPSILLREDMHRSLILFKGLYILKQGKSSFGLRLTVLQTTYLTTNLKIFSPK